ncbi:MAG: CoA transferase [Acidimicrobiia bacterium]|nr:CoA transferase [Acidimicrobiia bacterium]
MTAPGQPTPYLAGTRVLDFTQYLAGPSCTRLMAEMGADVIKVEIAPHGDPIRVGSPRRDHRSGYFVQQNRGKRSICVDLRRAEAIEALLRLVPHVDVVVENFSAGVMARRGLGYDVLSSINPRLVMASISGFGQTGPLAHKTSFDLIAQAMSGIMHVTGEPDGPPMFVGAGIGDCTAGFHAFAAIGYALLHRVSTGRGTHIDISMVDSLFHMHEMNVHAPSMTGGEYKPHRNGAHHPAVAPAGVFKAPQGWIAILCSQLQLPGLWAALGRPELGEDERFRTNRGRLEHIGELVELVEGWMASFATDAEVLAALEAQRVPCGLVLDPADAAHHPYFVERGMVRQVTDPRAGTFDIPGFPLRFSDAPPEPDLATPALGEHNREVLHELAGYENAEIDALVEAGVLFRKDW